MLTGFSRRNKAADNYATIWLVLAIDTAAVWGGWLPKVMLLFPFLFFAFLAYQHFCPAHFGKGKMVN